MSPSVEVDPRSSTLIPPPNQRRGGLSHDYQIWALARGYFGVLNGCRRPTAASFVATSSDRVAIPAISQWLLARKTQLTAPPGPKIRPGRAIEFPILSEYAG